MWRYSLRAPKPARSATSCKAAWRALWCCTTCGVAAIGASNWRGKAVAFKFGAFLKSVLDSRRSQVRAMPLHEVAKRNVNAAIAQANGLPPAGRVEALLLIAGQLLG
jgi:hypothetical protein